MAEFLARNWTPPEHDSAAENLMSVAFEKSWRFIEKDSFIAHNPKGLLRDRLQVYLEIPMRKGQQELMHLANGAIWNRRAGLGRQ
jgi:hypothetical protein